MSPPDGNLGAVREAVYDASPVAPPPDPAGPTTPQDEGTVGLPPDCPVEALGLDGDICYYLDVQRQLRALPAREHSRLGVLMLFGRRSDLLYRYWPRVSKEGDVTGWRPEMAAEALVAAASRRGVWNALQRVRGTGAWVGSEGQLVLHYGDAIWHGPTRGQPAGRWCEPGQEGEHVYPAAASTPRHAAERAPGGERGPAHDLLALLRTWRWRRGDLDAHLLLGWMCAALIGGAIEWRPMAWITGDRATGKSTLHQVLRLTLQSIVSVSDATGAGIWQRLGHAAVPVAIDELEADEDNRRAFQIVKLARQAASGGVVLRGGADHRGTEFTARSCFLFSSILIPPMLGQDRSRLAILELDPLVAEGEAFRSPPALEPQRLATLGAALRRRLLDGWPRWAATLEAYRQALAAQGHGGRGADQLGTLLAAADLALHDRPPSGDDLDDWAARLKPSGAGDQADDADHERCVAHLVTSPVDVYRGGERKVLNHWLQAAAGYLKGVDRYEAERVLATYGLKIHAEGTELFLAVCNSHQGLAQIFAGTHWAGRSGAAGVWAQALRRVPGARLHTGLRFAGVQARCTLIPLAAAVLPGEDGVDAP